jgi:hypothetical protein
MENLSVIITGLIIIGFLPQIHLLMTLFIMCIGKLFNKLFRLVIDLLGILFCLIFFCPPVILLLIIFFIYYLF